MVTLIEPTPSPEPNPEPSNDTRIPPGTVVVGTVVSATTSTDPAVRTGTDPSPATRAASARTPGQRPRRVERVRMIGLPMAFLASLLVVAGAVAVVWRPLLVVVALAGIVTLTAMIIRIEWAALVYVAAEPFGDYLTTVSSQSVKAIGVLLFAAWLFRLRNHDRPVSLRHPAVLAAAALTLVLLASTVASSNGPAAIEVVSRYLSYIAVLIVLVDSMRTGLAPRRVAAVFVASCSAAAVVGLVVFLNSGGGRAAGPMQDANDFAFYLICAIPFALVLWREATRYRHLYALAAVLLVVSTLATFSRGAILGIIAMLGVAVLLGLLRWRVIVAGAAAIMGAVLIVLTLAPALVARSFEEKQHVAGANVDSRFTSWTIAAEMTADRPFLGYGPGGFRTHFDGYIGGRVADTTHLDVAHQMLLDVSSELGLLGLAAFLAMIAAGIVGAVRAHRQERHSRLAAAVLLAFVGTLVAATFLSEQYYLPIWLLVALGAALDPTRKADLPRCVSYS